MNQYNGNVEYRSDRRDPHRFRNEKILHGCVTRHQHYLITSVDGEFKPNRAFFEANVLKHSLVRARRLARTKNFANSSNS